MLRPFLYRINLSEPVWRRIYRHLYFYVRKKCSNFKHSTTGLTWNGFDKCLLRSVQAYTGGLRILLMLVHYQSLPVSQTRRIIFVSRPKICIKEAQQKTSVSPYLSKASTPEQMPLMIFLKPYKIQPIWYLSYIEKYNGVEIWLKIDMNFWFHDCYPQMVFLWLRTLLNALFDFADRESKLNDFAFVCSVAGPYTTWSLL